MTTRSAPPTADLDAFLRALFDALPEGAGALGFANVLLAWLRRWDLPPAAVADLTATLQSFSGIDSTGGVRGGIGARRAR